MIFWTVSSAYSMRILISLSFSLAFLRIDNILVDSLTLTRQTICRLVGLVMLFLVESRSSMFQLENPSELSLHSSYQSCLVQLPVSRDTSNGNNKFRSHYQNNYRVGKRVVIHVVLFDSL